MNSLSAEPFLRLLILGTIPFMIVQGLFILFRKKISERLIRRISFLHVLFLSLLWCGSVLLTKDIDTMVLHLGRWFQYKDYQFELVFIWDRLSCLYSFLCLFVFSIIYRFSFQYLHREPRFQQFFFLLSMTAQGALLISFSGNIDVLVAGWEWVGICSVSLIAFFNQNLRSASNSIRAMVSYRICDAALLISAIGFHHQFGIYQFKGLTQNSEITSNVSGLFAFFLVLSIFAKSALFPLTNWIFRAVEGPTASSAIFYGALSVHLGPFLLLRTWDMWSGHLWIRVFLFAMALISALYSTLVGRVRPDIKTALAFSSVTQVCLVLMEIDFGFHGLAMIHIVAHSILRATQFLRSNSLLSDFQDNPEYRNSVSMNEYSLIQKLTGPRWGRRLYVYSVDLFYLDQMQDQLVKGLRFLSHSFVFFGFIAGIVCFLSYEYFSAPILQVFFLMVSLFLSVRAVTSSLVLDSFFSVVLSQTFLLIISIFSNEYATKGALIIWVGMPFAQIYLFSFMMKWMRAGGVTHLRGFQGAAGSLPGESHYFILFSWILSGVPGSLAFLGEDLLFHGFLEGGMISAMMMVFITCINGIAYYRIYGHLFMGPQNESSIPLPMGRFHRMSCQFFVLFTFLAAMGVRFWL